jgi:biopolymer transport protein ExbD
VGFAAESRERARPVLPLAGLIDVLFLLLIFVMSTYSIREQELEIDVGLPAAETGEAGTADALKVVISFDQDGRLFLGDRSVAMEDLRGELEELASFAPDQPVIVRGDARAQYGVLLEIMDQAKLAGLNDVKLAVVREE